jgi:hypothetical protein
MNPTSTPIPTQPPAAPPKNGTLVSYIAPGAPATRRPAMGDEPYLRLEIGFTPAWYRQHADIDFGARIHTDPAYRRESVPEFIAGFRETNPLAKIISENLDVDRSEGFRLASWGGIPHS